MIIKDLELKVGSLNEERISLIAKDKVVSKDLIRISEHSGILGHSNPNQKIQHVVELKETNINLKRVTFFSS